MHTESPNNEIQRIEQEIAQLTQKLEQLRKIAVPQPVPNYSFSDLTGEVALLKLFGDKDQLIAIHNMGQGCRYCTLWADGINAFLPHLESQVSIVLLSKDSPRVQRNFANARQWRFRMASHGGGKYIEEQAVAQGGNMPGIVCYERRGEQIYRKNASVFGPGDLFCAHWHILSLAGVGTEDWTPQYSYWLRPHKMDDGGENLLESK